MREFPGHRVLALGLVSAERIHAVPLGAIGRLAEAEPVCVALQMGVRAPAHRGKERPEPGKRGREGLATRPPDDIIVYADGPGMRLLADVFSDVRSWPAGHEGTLLVR